MSDGKVTTVAPHEFSQVPQESVKLAAARSLPRSSKGEQGVPGGRTFCPLFRYLGLAFPSLETIGP
jgi:hypothetical protein